MPAAEVQLYRPGSHHEVRVVPFTHPQPKRPVIAGSAVEVGAVEDGDRHGGRFHAPGDAIPHPPRSESWVEAHNRNVTRSAGGPQRTTGADEHPRRGSQPPEGGGRQRPTAATAVRGTCGLFDI